MRILDKYERLLRRGLKLVGAQSHYRVVAGRRLHYYELEGQGPGSALVLLHGLGANANSFAPILSGLRKGWKRIYVPDMPGHGFSLNDPGLELLNLRGLGELVHAFMQEVVREPAALVGNSMGGALAMGVAIEKSADVTALGLLAPAGAPLTADDLALLHVQFNPKTRREAIGFVNRLTHRPLWPALLVASEIREMIRAVAPQHILAQTTPGDHLDETALRNLKIPTLLIWGASEKVLPASGLPFLRAHLPPQARIEVFERCGHMPQMEKPRRTLQLLNELGRATAVGR